MVGQRWDAARNTVLGVGLALALAAALLWWASERAPAIQASAGPENTSSAEPGHTTRRSDVSPAWVSMEPTSTLYVEGFDLVWPIPQYGVTVTFYDNSVTENAIITFTPQISSPLGVSAMASTSYFFELKGVYEEWHTPVSLHYGGIDIALAYAEPELGDVSENSLGVFYKTVPGGIVVWERQSATVNVLSNQITWHTNKLGSFGIGGYGHQTHLPLIIGGADQSILAHQNDKR